MRNVETDAYCESENTRKKRDRKAEIQTRYPWTEICRYVSTAARTCNDSVSATAYHLGSSHSTWLTIDSSNRVSSRPGGTRGDITRILACARSMIDA